MARESDRSARDSRQKVDNDDGSAAASKGTSKASGAANSESASGEAAKAAGSSDRSLAEFQEGRDKELREILIKRSDDSNEGRAIVKEFAAIWLPRRAAEIDVLLPTLEEAGIDDEKMTAAEIRADMVSLLLAHLIETGAREGARASLEALADAVEALAAASAAQRQALSEHPGAQASAMGPQLEARYERIKSRFANLDEAVGEALELLAPRTLSVSPLRQRSGKERSMPRNSEMPERDDRGRFMSDDEREYSRGGYRSESARYSDENGRRSSGRYEDDDRPMRRARSDDEGRYGRRDEGRGHGGWFGDSEGHSEASRRGWREGDHGESGWFGDPRGHSEASRRGWRSGEHGESGWFGDPEGHSEASRRSWREGEHGDSGWFGDPRGHSEAARRGWESGHEGNARRSPRYAEDTRRGGSSSRYEDLDDYEPRGRSHGGWSGDPEGHSEASRRGWAQRR